MHLLIDAAPLQTPARDRGIGRYTSNLLAALAVVRPGWRIEVIEHARLDAIDPATVHGLPIVRFPGLLPYSPATRAANDRYFGDWIAARRPDRILLASVFEKLGVIPKFDGPRPPIVAILYDLIPILFHEHYGVRQPSEEWYADRFRDTANVDALLAISEAAAADTRRLIGAGCPPTMNIQGAVDPRLAPSLGGCADPSPVLAKYGVDRPFILYVGGYDYRKNLSGAVAGFAALPADIRERYQLVIGSFLPEHLRESTLTAAKQLGVGESVVLTGHVSDAELQTLYQSCRLLFFPSMYEGLGLPVLEGLRCGSPVAVANGSSMPEFAGPGARFFDPHSATSMADALADALREPAELRRSERIAFAESFTWRATAEKTAVALEQCQRTVTVPRPRIAEARVNGMSQAGNRLAECFTVEQIVLPDVSVPTELARRYCLLTTDEVNTRHTAKRYDLFVFHVGLTDQDSQLLPLMRRHRGVIVAHGYPAKLAAIAADGAFHTAAAIVTTDAETWKLLRRAVAAPVVWIRDQDSESYTVAILDAMREMRATDQRWRDAAMNALADVPGDVPPDVFGEWARLRTDVLRGSCSVSAPARHAA